MHFNEDGYRLRADVPAGILLSGGLDSSLIAAMAARSSPAPVRTFTAGFRHRLDERLHARRVAELIGSRHHEVELDPGELNRRVEEVIPTFDALTSLDAGIFTIYFILEKLRRFQVKVLQVGEGKRTSCAGWPKVFFLRKQLPGLSWVSLSR